MLIKHQSFDISQETKCPKRKRGERLYEPKQCRYFKFILIPGIIGFMLLCILMNVDFAKEFEEIEHNGNIAKDKEEIAIITENVEEIVTVMSTTATTVEDEMVTDSDITSAGTEMAFQPQQHLQTIAYPVVAELGSTEVLPTSEPVDNYYQFKTTTELPIQISEIVQFKEKEYEINRNPYDVSNFLEQLLSHPSVNHFNILKASNVEQKPENSAATNDFVKQLLIAVASAYQIGHSLQESFAKMKAANRDAKDKQLYEGEEHSSTRNDLTMPNTNDKHQLDPVNNVSSEQNHLDTKFLIEGKAKHEIGKASTKSTAKLSKDVMQRSTVVEKQQTNNIKLVNQFPEEKGNTVGNTNRRSTSTTSQSNDQYSANNYNKQYEDISKNYTSVVGSANNYTVGNAESSLKANEKSERLQNLTIFEPTKKSEKLQHNETYVEQLQYTIELFGVANHNSKAEFDTSNSTTTNGQSKLELAATETTLLVGNEEPDEVSKAKDVSGEALLEVSQSKPLSGHGLQASFKVGKADSKLFTNKTPGVSQPKHFSFKETLLHGVGNNASVRSKLKYRAMSQGTEETSKVGEIGNAISEQTTASSDNIVSKGNIWQPTNVKKTNVLTNQLLKEEITLHQVGNAYSKQTATVSDDIGSKGNIRKLTNKKKANTQTNHLLNEELTLPRNHKTNTPQEISQADEPTLKKPSLRAEGHIASLQNTKKLYQENKDNSNIQNNNIPANTKQTNDDLANLLYKDTKKLTPRVVAYKNPGDVQGNHNIKIETDQLKGESKLDGDANYILSEDDIILTHVGNTAFAPKSRIDSVRNLLEEVNDSAVDKYVSQEPIRNFKKLDSDILNTDYTIHKSGNGKMMERVANYLSVKEVIPSEIHKTSSKLVQKDTLEAAMQKVQDVQNSATEYTIQISVNENFNEGVANYYMKEVIPSEIHKTFSILVQNDKPEVIMENVQDFKNIVTNIEHSESKQKLDRNVLETVEDVTSYAAGNTATPPLPNIVPKINKSENSLTDESKSLKVGNGDLQLTLKTNQSGNIPLKDPMILKFGTTVPEPAYYTANTHSSTDVRDNTNISEDYQQPIAKIEANHVPAKQEMLSAHGNTVSPLLYNILYKTNKTDDFPLLTTNHFKVGNISSNSKLKTETNIWEHYPAKEAATVGNTRPLPTATYEQISLAPEDTKNIAEFIQQSSSTIEVPGYIDLQPSHQQQVATLGIGNISYKLTPKVKYKRIKRYVKDSLNKKNDKPYSENKNKPIGIAEQLAKETQTSLVVNKNFLPISKRDAEHSLPTNIPLQQHSKVQLYKQLYLNTKSSQTTANYITPSETNGAVNQTKATADFVSNTTAPKSTHLQVLTRVQRAANISSFLAGAMPCIPNKDTCNLSCDTGSVAFIDEDLEKLMPSCRSEGIALELKNCEFVSGKMQSTFFFGSYILRELHIINCNLVTIANGAFNKAHVKNLQILKFINNSITALTESTFVGLTALKEFEFSQTIMSNCAVGSMFLKPMAVTLTSVKVMQILENKGTVDPKEWLKGLDLIALAVVDLQNNNLRGVLNAETFQTLVAVASLNLENCYLDRIDIPTFLPIMNSLTTLNLNSNSLVTLDPAFLMQMQQHQITLSLNNSKWQCDCEHEDLVKYIQNEDQFIYINRDDYVCQEPEALRHYNMQNVSLNCGKNSTTPDGNTTTATTPTVTLPTTNTTLPVTLPTTIPVGNTTLPVTLPTTIPDDNTTTPETDATTNSTTSVSTIVTTTPNSNFEDITCHVPNSDDIEIISMAKPKTTLTVQPRTATSVTITSSDVVDNYHIIYFCKDVQYTLVKSVSPTEWILYQLFENQAYIFCLINADSELVSPFDCWPHFVRSSSSWRMEKWLRTNDLGWFISVVTISALIFFVIGAIIVYLILRQRPSWLLTANGRVLKVHPCSHKVVLMPKGASNMETARQQQSADSNQTSRRVSYLGPRTECSSTANLYASHHQPPAEVAPTVPVAADRGSLCSIYKPPLEVSGLNILNTHLKSLACNEAPDNIYNEIDYYEVINF